jgi:Fe-S-cluster containining protein
MSEVTNYCKMCGMCCKAISIRFTIEELKRYSDASAKFIVENWTPISKEQALKINPYLQKWLDKSPNRFFYTCNKLVDNKCSIHDENKPFICSGYPFYNRPKLDSGSLFYVEECGFNKEELMEVMK